MNVPTLLYKYESFSAQSIENLKNQIIYFGSPSRFNDPYDCAVSPRIKDPTDEEVEKIQLHYLSQHDLPVQVRQRFQGATLSSLREMVLRIGQNALDDAVKKFLSQQGVSCFSEKPDNLLMWSHYAGHHKGFCLEFKTNLEPFAKIKQVKYSTSMPSFDLVPMLCERNFDQIVDLFCIKSIDWQYEREWRAIHREAGTAYTYPAAALTGVYFGPKASFTSIEIIALVLAGQNEHVKLWQGKQSKSAFSVDFDLVTYMPNVEARRRGLLPNEKA